MGWFDVPKATFGRAVRSSTEGGANELCGDGTPLTYGLSFEVEPTAGNQWEDEWSLYPAGRVVVQCFKDRLRKTTRAQLLPDVEGFLEAIKAAANVELASSKMAVKVVRLTSLGVYAPSPVYRGGGGGDSGVGAGTAILAGVAGYELGILSGGHHG